MIRTCPMCKETKEMKPKGYCPPCHAKYVREWYLRNKDSVRDTQFKLKYDISLEEYNNLLAKQNGVCAICKIESTGRFKLAVDHDHKFPDIVRGLLCNSCNNGLGRFKDSIEILEAAIKYLKETQ